MTLLPYYKSLDFNSNNFCDSDKMAFLQFLTIFKAKLSTTSHPWNQKLKGNKDEAKHKKVFLIK